jgi:hypothetical protein
MYRDTLPHDSLEVYARAAYSCQCRPAHICQELLELRC